MESGEDMRSHELGKSSEDYLESILIIIQEKGACRPTDIADQMNFSKPSVSVALKKLEEEGYIERDDWRILLTERGKAAASRTLEKHEYFKALFESIGIDAETAEEEACLVEHVISEDSFHKMRAAWKVDTEKW
ncbi:metal-dependent transcriptional regulator [Moryella indoligenes]|nr:metal-dependent transcriptional regulator [Moryella indoligenes]